MRANANSATGSAAWPPWLLAVRHAHDGTVGTPNPVRGARPSAAAVIGATLCQRADLARKGFASLRFARKAFVSLHASGLGRRFGDLEVNRGNRDDGLTVTERHCPYSGSTAAIARNVPDAGANEHPAR